MKFQDISRYSIANYRVNMPWTHIEHTLEQYEQSYGLEIEPDFQRAHVWNEKQQSAFVEYRLQNGMSGRELFFNAANWQGQGIPGKLVLVDGLQRLTAVRKFLRGKLKVFGNLYTEFEDHIGIMTDFIFAINDLSTRAEVLKWYIDLNAGGIAHTDEEIQKVRKLLEKE